MSFIFKNGREKMEKIKILIVDDHTLLRQALRLALESSSNFSIVGEAASGEEAIQLIEHLRPDVITMDINLTGINGIETTREIKKKLPRGKVLGLSQHTHPSYALRMMQAGASGYVTKTSTKDEMVKAITEIQQGKKYICAEIENNLSNQKVDDAEKANINSLSARELEVIKYIKEGSSSKEIAQTLYRSVKTVEVHRYNILRKLKLKNAAALVNFINNHPELEI
jgi:two-component system invasion response regulator UvrY